MFEYELKLSKRRKSVAIKVTPERVVVSAPFNVCRSSLGQWLETKSKWVQAQQSKLQYLPSKQSPLLTSKLSLFGQIYDIEFLNISEASVDHHRNLINLPECLKTQPAEVRKALIAILTSQLNDYLNAHLNNFALAMRCTISSVKIREYKSRWGSCSSKQALTFNCLLAGAPKAMIDYVIIHELAHCHVMAHNHKFWQLVSEHFGDYQQARKWFSKYGKQLMIE